MPTMHTPGPWHLIERQPGRGEVRTAEEGHIVYTGDLVIGPMLGIRAMQRSGLFGSCEGGHVADIAIAHEGRAEALANARLVIAAPDLFGAMTIDDIEAVIDGLEHFCIGPGEDADGELTAIWQPYIDKLNALRAAIAKAEGR